MTYDSSVRIMLAMAHHAASHVDLPIDPSGIDALAELVAQVIVRLRPAAAEPAPPARLLSKGELAHAVHRSVPTIDRWAADGMPYIDMGTYRLYDLDACTAWVAGRPRPGRPIKAAPAGL